MAGFLTKIIRWYQHWLSPVLAPRCRYQPTCSAYALQAVELHGARRGMWLALKRILTCHPLGGHGFDPVPGSEMPTKDES